MASGNDGYFGYGFSAEGLRTSHEELSSGESARGPNCPLTGDLIDFMRGTLDPPVSQEVEKHVEGCDRCHDLLESQRRAEKILHTLDQEARQGPTVRSHLSETFAAYHRPVWKGTIEHLQNMKVSDEEEEVRQRVKVSQISGEPEIPFLTIVLDWSRPRSSDPGENPWYLSLSLPCAEVDSESETPREQLNHVNSHRVRLSFRSKNGQEQETSAQLDWDGYRRQLVSSRPERVSLEDPQALETIKIALGRAIDGLDAG